MPRETLTVKTFKDGINSNNSPGDIIDTSVVDMVNMSPQKNGNLSLSPVFKLYDNFRYKIPYGLLGDQFNRFEDTKMPLHLVPGFGCTSFRTDHCLIIPIEHEAATGTPFWGNLDDMLDSNLGNAGVLGVSGTVDITKSAFGNICSRCEGI